MYTIGKAIAFEPTSHLVEHPLTCAELAAFFSSFSSRSSDPSSDFDSKIKARSVESDDFDATSNGYDAVGKLGAPDLGDWSFLGSTKNDCEDDQSSKFDIFDDIEEPDGEEEKDSDDDDDDLMVLGSSNRVHEQKENFVRVEGDEDEFRHPLVREVCRLLELRSGWNPKLEGQLRNLLRSLKARQADERVALEFFYWADRQWRYKHYPVVYYAMLEVLSKTKLCQGAKRVLRLMARRGIERSPEAFGYVMVSYSRAGKLRHAMRVLTLMQKAGVELNVSICNTAIHALVMGNKLEKALRVLERMQLVGIAPNEKRVKEVRELVEKMTNDGGLLPDQVTYNNLVHMLSKHGYGDEAVEFLREAEDKGFRFDKVGYSAIVHSFCKDGRIDMAKEIVNEMFSKGCTPDVVTYTAVLNGYCRLGKVDQAKKMLQHMYKHGCKPNTVSYTALLNGLCRSQNSLEAREMMNMSEEEWWTPNAITYSVLMHGLRREGKLVEACDMVREMSLCREGKINEAKRFMEECLNKGCAVNVVNFTTVIHGYCQKDDLETALSLLDDMYLSNKHPDAITYTTVINALGKKGRIQEATKLMIEMLGKGLDPTPVTYRTVIHWYCQTGSVDDLVKLLEKMFLRQNCKTAYNQVIEKLCSFGKLEEADKLLGKVLRTAARVDAKTCHVLMDSYLRKGTPLSAYKVACRMFNRNLIPDLKLCEKVTKRLMSEGNSKEADNLMLRIEKTDMNAGLRGCFQLQGVTEGRAMPMYFVMEPDSGIRDLVLQLHHYAHGTRQWNKRLGTAIKSICTCSGAHV
ncbi:Tetratricopeptide repeat-like superfamily protein [Prunus dulcis]|uniref:Tetratricopeptide repeat-like superfamily protein n=1 Tax=Prunus dulcis TaxID=3755 RepID=A0A4Y1RAY4_PRUDU|nr:Tetratricopeptide repeat-like superfamily protein [Prunus dulcis]